VGDGTPVLLDSSQLEWAREEVVIALGFVVAKTPVEV
jgi:hypothetical protein